MSEICIKPIVKINVYKAIIFKYRVSSIEYRVSSIEYRVSSIEYPMLLFRQLSTQILNQQALNICNRQVFT
jgi:hypothetical protein